jgi:methionine biosynthesis protein MetW
MSKVQSEPGAADGDPMRYYRWRRPEIIEQVPPHAKNVLSIGCGAGASEAELVKRGARVTGVELAPTAAAEARRNGLNVIEADANVAATQLGAQQFDCMIYADVLEHLVDPEGVLRSYLPRLVPGGAVIVSVPNFRHYTVLWQLGVRGRIRYTEWGILDRTHLRITTRRMVLDWFQGTGILPRSVTYRMHRRREQWMSHAMLGLAREFLARQVILVGTAPAASNAATD